MKRGSVIWLTLPRIGHVAATVRWAGDYEAGCEFLTPLDATAYAELLGG